MSKLWQMLRGDQLKAEDDPQNDEKTQGDQTKIEDAQQKTNQWVRFAPS
jgi:hypothetical protein